MLEGAAEAGTFLAAAWQSLGMFSVDTPSDPTIQLMGICPQETPSWVHREHVRGHSLRVEAGSEVI